ncbi:MAG: DUF1292 domain-containing protein [Candidatus Cloacimonetes bacterium]|nr:DUF1292 domain-containing protein [Candidatus Cloacimonadota bacterium]MDD4100294.1 DUF1292 domain-containing protein [Candidatus Cloacimonadota bacterium]
MIDKDNELIHDGHECDCEGDDCACGEHEQNIITLDMEDGSQKDFEVLQIINHEGKNYIALAELGTAEYDILRFEEVDESVELSIIEDDDEFNAVAAVFDDIFSSEDPDMLSAEEDENQA